MMLKYQSTQRRIKEAEEQLDEIKNYFRERIGNATRLFVDLHAVTYSAAVQKFSVNWEAVAREFSPSHEIIAKHTTEKTSPRVMRLKIDGDV